ncbi:hypothetical protein BSMD_043360 [Bacillus subtilis Miyagi-4]|nr:hypothetical protein BSMD_043360 [Bacillus subtilis Miyagi-4]
MGRAPLPELQRRSLLLLYGRGQNGTMRKTMNCTGTKQGEKAWRNI